MNRDVERAYRSLPTTGPMGNRRAVGDRVDLLALLHPDEPVDRPRSAENDPPPENAELDLTGPQDENAQLDLTGPQDENAQLDLTGQQDENAQLDLTGPQDENAQLDLTGQQDENAQLDLTGPQDENAQLDLTGQQDENAQLDLTGTQDEADRGRPPEGRPPGAERPVSPFARLVVTAPIPKRRRRFRPPTLLIAALGLIAVIAVLALPRWLDESRGAAGGPDAQAFVRAAGWLTQNLESGDLALADAGARAALIDEGVSADRLVDPQALTTPTGGTNPCCSFVIDSPSTRTEAEQDELGAALATSAPVARFRDGGAQVEIRRLVPPSASGADPAAATDARARAGQQLAQNSALSFEGDSRDMAVAGRVDERLMALLASLSSDHRMTIGAFPPVIGEEDLGLRREVEIVAVDGVEVTPGAPAPSDLLRSAQSQQGVFAPRRSVLEPSATGSDSFVIRITYDLPLPSGPSSDAAAPSVDPEELL